MMRTFEKQAPQIAASAFVDQTAIIIGKVTIGDGSSIWPNAVIRGDINRITIGKRCSIQDGTVIHVNHAGPFNPEGDAVTIDDDVTIGHRALLHGCHIGEGSLIGMGAIVMDSVVVEPTVLVAAGSLVAPGTVLTSGYLWIGSPARRARPLTATEKEKLAYSARYYAALGQRHANAAD